MSGVSLGTVIVFSTQSPRLRAFYAQGLALGDPDTEMPRHVGWQLGGMYFGIDAVDEPLGAPPSAVTLWFEVPDLQAAYERCLATGATARAAPEKKPWGGFIASVLDPDGNVVGLSERK